MCAVLEVVLLTLLWGPPGVTPADDKATHEPGSHHLLRLLTDSGSPQGVRTLTFAPDGSTLLVSAGSDRVRFVRAADGEMIGEYDLVPFSMAYSRDGSRLLMTSEVDTVLLDTKRWAEVEMDHTADAGYVGVRFERKNGRVLISELLSGGPAEASGVLHVGDEVVSVGDGKSGPMTDVTGRPIAFIQELMAGPVGGFVRLGVLPRGTFKPEVHAVQRQALRQVGDELLFQPIQPGDAGENVIVMADDERRYVLRSARTGRVLSRLMPDAVENRGQWAVSPDGTRFALLARRADGEPGTAVEIFRVETGETERVVPFAKDSWYGVAFSADGSQLLVGTWDTVEVLDLERGEFVEPMRLAPKPQKEEPAEPTTGGGTPGASVAVAAADIVGPIGNEDLAEDRQLTSLATSSRGLIAVGGPDGRVRLWDLNAKRPVYAFERLAEEPVTKIAFSPDGRWLTYYVESGELHLVDVSEIRPEPATEPEGEDK